ncbi:unnamed protein product, partial [marine sediment metagenome]
YRKNKYSKVTGIFQFMFVDNWNAITWSVVDYSRRPKKGYFTLKTAYQPVLIGMDLDRERLNVDVLRFGFPEIWIVNDNLKQYKNMCVKISLLKDKKVVMEEEIKIGNLPADYVKYISCPSILKQVENLDMKEKGDYIIELKLRDQKGNTISKNSYLIELV